MIVYLVVTKTEFRSIVDARNSISNLFDKSLGDLSDEGTPGPIPNPVVKLVSADGTWGAAPWESRSLPRDFFI